MLRSLHISNYVLIDSLDVEFPEGLVIVTGQTGAGKSILLGALSLLSGSKADPGHISEGADSCVVEAEFSVSEKDAALQEITDENDIDFDGGTLIVRRVLSRSGRSRCFVNDIPVQIHCLQSLSERLVDIHSQHRSLLLTDPAFQLSVLDRFAGNGELLEKVASSWKEMTAESRRLSDLRTKLRTLSEDSEYNSELCRRLVEADLVDGELEELEQEQKTLSHAEQIREDLGLALSCLRPDEESLSLKLREARKFLDKTSEYVPGAVELSSRCQSAEIEIDDIADSVENACSAVEVNPSRLQQVDERLSLLYGLLRRHQCSTVGELIALRDSLAQSALSSGDLEEDIRGCEKRLEAARAAYDKSAAELSAGRRKAAPEFSSAITGSLRFLELERAVFETDVIAAAASGTGTDCALFKFSSTGASPVDIAKCASGGELSRIMLSLKEMMARYFGMPTMIFDEIDTGVSGSVADRMGTVICRMGADMQVFSITHLPQVAAKGRAHYLVTKSYRADGTAITSIKKLSGQDRLMEIARMLSGSEITPQAIENARVLLADNADC